MHVKLVINNDAENKTKIAENTVSLKCSMLAVWPYILWAPRWSLILAHIQFDDNLKKKNQPKHFHSAPATAHQKPNDRKQVNACE